MTEGAKLGVGEIISGTLSAVRERPVPYLAFTAGMTVLTTAVDQLGSAASTPGMSIAGIVAGFALLSHLLTAEGMPPSRSFGAGFLSYFGASILSGIAVFFGLLLLIVPGLILLSRWSVSSGLVVTEDAPALDSLQRSWELTRASQWSIFWAGLIFALVMIVVLGAVGGGIGMLQSLAEGNLVAELSLGESLTVNALTQAITAVGMAGVLYLTKRLTQFQAGLQDVFE